MLKKFWINVSLILIGFIIYFLQANFFSWFNINGIKPNLFVIYILFIGLFGNRSMAIIYGAVYGIFLDLLYETRVGVNLIGLVIVGLIAILFNKNFSKDSRLTVMFMVFGTTILFETITYFTRYIIYSSNIEIGTFIRILLVEVIYNLMLTIIIYEPMQRYGYYIENTYKRNKILTRYF